MPRKQADSDKTPTARPKKRAGRPLGAVSWQTKEIRGLSRAMLEDPVYRAGLKTRLDEGKAPHMETLLHHYAYGKPKERIEHSGPEGGPIREIQHFEVVVRPEELPSVGPAIDMLPVKRTKVLSSGSDDSQKH